MNDLALAIAGTLVLAICLVIFFAPRKVIVALFAVAGLALLVSLWLSGLGIIAV